MRLQRQSASRTTSSLRRRRAGFALVDALIATAILLVAALGHVSSVVWQHRMNRTTEEGSVAVETLARFVDRLRADADWATLYSRLRTLSQESTGASAASSLGADPALVCHSATTYYSDFTVPSALPGAKFLVQVPSTLVDGVAALRENAVLSRYGLPYDLNADGTVDGASRDDDYATLPVVVRIRWQRAGQDAQELVMATWLRGER
jgi:uncharacterized membrane protein YbhN (UPF0104 family)